MTDQPNNTLPVCAKPIAGPASQGDGFSQNNQSKFWQRFEELYTLGRLHANSDQILNIVTDFNLDEDGRVAALERLAASPRKQGADMFPNSTATTTTTTTTTPAPVSTLPASEVARHQSMALSITIKRAMGSSPSHLQMLAVEKVYAELVADTVISRQLGPVEGLLDEIESNLDFENSMAVRQYARGLAALIEDCRCRIANL